MALIQSLISQDKYPIKCPYTMTPKGICVHNTGNDASAKNEIAYMKNNNNEVSFHVAIDDLEAIQGIPFDRNAWAAGDGGNGDGNRNYIHIEICYNLSGGDKFDKAEILASKEIAQLLKKFGWTVKNIKRHYDFSGKNCPERTILKGWQRFLDMVQAELNRLNKVKEVIKVGYIIQYSNPVDHAIAEVMADRLNCPTINCLRPFAYYNQYEIVISVGEGKNKSRYTNVNIAGKNRAETLRLAIEYLEKLGK